MKFKYDLLAEDLVDEMKSQGLSTRDVAQEVGISHSTVSRVTRGLPCHVDSLAKLCGWLGMDPGIYFWEVVG